MNDLRTLTSSEIDNVSGGFVCAGLCVLGAIIVGIGIVVSGMKIGQAAGEAF